VVLVTPLLKGTKNFQSWILSMRVALVCKNKLGFVDGTIPIPEKQDSHYNQWLRCNSMILAWLQRSCSPNVQKSIIFFRTASTAWKDLHDQFDQGDMFKIADLHEDIYKLSQGSRDISDYYIQLKSLWDELESFRPLPQCKCSIQCSCGAIQSIRLFKDQDYTIRFLKGLNDEYSHVRSQIMMMEPFPSVSKAFSLVAQQESEFHISNVETKLKDLTVDSGKACVANGSYSNFSNRGRGGYNNNKGRGRQNSGGRGQGGNRLCTNCNKTNHTVDTCYFLHGFPPGYQTRNTAKSSPSANLAFGGTKSDAEQISTSDTSTNGVLLSQEQYKGLMELLQQSKHQIQSSTSANIVMTSTNPFSNSVTSNSLAFNTNSHTTFGKNLTSRIIDTGATNHITHNFSILTKCHSINPIRVDMPNNTYAIATLAGTVLISTELQLHNVFLSLIFMQTYFPCQNFFLIVTTMLFLLLTLVHFCRTIPRG
jgi:hypothetical protein